YRVLSILHLLQEDLFPGGHDLRIRYFCKTYGIGIWFQKPGVILQGHSFSIDGVKKVSPLNALHCSRSIGQNIAHIADDQVGSGGEAHQAELPSLSNTYPFKSLLQLYVIIHQKAESILGRHQTVIEQGFGGRKIIEKLVQLLL